MAPLQVVHFREIETDPAVLSASARAHRFVGDAAADFETAYALLSRGGQDDSRGLRGLAYYLIAANVHELAPSDAPLPLLDRAERELMPLGSSWELAATLLLRCEVLVNLGQTLSIGAPLARACAISHELQDAALLAWALYLHSATLPYEDALPTLLAALDLAESRACPELEWQIHRRIAAKSREGGIAWLERDAFVEARDVLEEMCAPLDERGRGEFWSRPDRAAFLRDWSALPLAAAGPTSDWDFLHEQREESRRVLPAYCRPE